MRSTETGTRIIHGITLERDSDGSFAVTMPNRWFSASPENDAEDNLEGEVCMLLDHLWNAAAAGVRARPFIEPQAFAKALMTPEQEAAAQSGRCWKCEAQTLSEKHREGGMRWLHCSRCATICTLGVNASADAQPRGGA